MSYPSGKNIYNSKKQREAAFKDFMSDPTTLNILRSSSAINPGDPGLTGVIRCVQEIGYGKTDDLPKLLNLGFGLLESGSNPYQALEELKVAYSAAKRDLANHAERRKLAFTLGLKQNPYSVAELLKSSQSSSDISPIRIIWKQRKDPLPGQCFMTESICLRSDDILLAPSSGFEIIDDNESVIFLSQDSSAESGYEIEMVVVRNVASEYAHCSEFYGWLQRIVATACSDRRNTRPDHPGSIVQLGWNAGPRHARIFGLTQSYVKKIAPDIMIDRDNDAIAAMTIMWGLVRSLIPSEVISEVNSRLDDAGMPRIATCNVEPGTGYTFNIGGKTYSFPHVERAPPEAYMSQDYEAWTHTDQAYAKYAFAWCVGRYVDEERWTPRASSRFARSQHPSLSIKPGGSFVDAGLRVVVRQAVGTLIAFKPEHQHGTSRLFGAHNRLCSINFSSHILKALEIAKDRAQVTAEEGAGEGDRDDY